MGQGVKRREDWPERLNDFLTAAEKRPFSWADFSCALFAADAVEAMTGIDFAEPYRGPTTKRGCLARLNKIAGGIEEAVTMALGLPLRNIKRARRGDVVLASAEIIGGDMDAIGICLGSRFALVTESGLGTAPMRLAVKVWRV